ncbi:MAG: acetolactate synthase [Candidatus Eremiobacteraeota bacterium]|nr:acetolactate synthase [Candidatus Eremiobacteraeota bacterium]
MAQTAPAATDLPKLDADQPPQTISGGHLVAKALKNEGIDVIFTLCGGHIIDIYDGCESEGIKIVDVRHEQVAAHAADGYARVTGKPGCAVVTAGPGTTNAVTGVANAFRAESPFLLIGGQGALNQHKMGSLQDLPHVEIMKPITKFASSVVTTERVADMVAMAFREAHNGSFGPSYLEIGRDILDGRVPLEKAVIPQAGHYRASTKSVGDPNAVEALADILVRAERPAVLFGQQTWTCRATEAAHAFARTFNIPAYMNGAGRGTFAPTDPHGFQLTRGYAFGKADVIVIVGTPFDFRMSYGKRLKAPTVVQIDMSYTTVGKNRDISLGLVGDVGAILRAVTQAASGRLQDGAARRQPWLDELRAEEKKLAEARLPSITSDATPIHPLRLGYEINEFLTDNTRFIGDGGDVVTAAGGIVWPKGPGLWMDPGPLGTLGVGVSFAMASKFAEPDKEVVCLFGDGTFGMTGWDMQTANRFNLPFVGIIGNNSYMNQIRAGQIMRYGKEKGDVGNYLGDVDFEKFAQMLGGYGEAVRDPKQIRPALDRAREAVRSTGKCAIVNVWIDPNEYAPGTMNQTMYK